ncbi:MAG: hypothetical protein AB8B65_20210 [Kordia sp.]|uniref:hypothetical protein n=1 Tax=Kordia sp. TaxID=1965332 RepID=UPI00385E38CD
MKRATLVKLCFLILGSNIYAQNIVVDSITKMPVESVHISYNLLNGLITNSDGYFKLPEDAKAEQITLSHIAYISKTVTAENFKNRDTIYITSNAIDLEKVVLELFAVKDTLSKAIDRIDKNYMDVPHNSYGFFRQSMQQDEKGIEMIEVDFVSYLKNRASSYSTKIITAERTKNYSDIRFSTIGGVYAIIEKGDFVKRKKYFLDKKEMGSYEFSYEGTLNNNGTKIYKIAFKPKDKNDLRHLRIGQVYLDAKSLAFMEISYEMDQTKLRKINSLSDPKLRRSRPVFFTKSVRSIIKYQKFNDDRWALSSIEVRNSKEGALKKKSHMYALIGKLIINKVAIDAVVEVETNFKTDKDFSKAIRRIDNVNDWNDSYKFPLSSDEKQVLEEIKNQK